MLLSMINLAYMMMMVFVTRTWPDVPHVECGDLPPPPPANRSTQLFYTSQFRCMRFSLFISDPSCKWSAVHQTVSKQTTHISCEGVGIWHWTGLLICNYISIHRIIWKLIINIRNGICRDFWDIGWWRVYPTASSGGSWVCGSFCHDFSLLFNEL